MLDNKKITACVKQTLDLLDEKKLPISDKITVLSGAMAILREEQSTQATALMMKYQFNQMLRDK